MFIHIALGLIKAVYHLWRRTPLRVCAFLYTFIKLLDLLTSIIYNNFDKGFVNPSVECFATYLKGECFLSLSVSPLVKVRVLTKDLTKFVRSFIMIYL